MEHGVMNVMFNSKKKKNYYKLIINPINN